MIRVYFEKGITIDNSEDQQDTRTSPSYVVQVKSIIASLPFLGGKESVGVHKVEYALTNSVSQGQYQTSAYASYRRQYALSRHAKETRG